MWWILPHGGARNRFLADDTRRSPVFTATRHVCFPVTPADKRLLTFLDKWPRFRRIICCGSNKAAVAAQCVIVRYWTPAGWVAKWTDRSTHKRRHLVHSPPATAGRGKLKQQLPANDTLFTLKPLHSYNNWFSVRTIKRVSFLNISSLWVLVFLRYLLSFGVSLYKCRFSLPLPQSASSLSVLAQCQNDESYDQDIFTYG